MTIHTHVETSSRDCDGQYDRSYIADRRIELIDLPSTGALATGTYTLTHEGFEADGDELLWVVTASTPTEEGYTSTELRECDDPTCDTGVSTFRDHTAERAGY